jgi:hypothetical protein
MTTGIREATPRTRGRAALLLQCGPERWCFLNRHKKATRKRKQVQLTQAQKWAALVASILLASQNVG